MNYLAKCSRQVVHLIWGLCTGVALFVPVIAQGATYYVAMTGSDSNPGTLSHPFKSFKKGVSLLQAGDTLYIRSGLYTEQIDLQSPNKTGTAGKYITVAGYPGETVTIQYTSPTQSSYGPIKARGVRGYLIFENLVLDGVNETIDTAISIAFGNHDVIYRNVEVKNFKKHGFAVNGNNIKIINSKIHDQVSPTGLPGQRWYGIYWQGGTNGLIEGNEIYRNPGGGIQIYPGPISNLTVRNNSIHDNNHLVTSGIGGIIVQGKTASDLVTSTQIYNNLIYRNGSHPSSGGGNGIEVQINTQNTKIWNNTIYGNKLYGIQISGSSMTIDTVVQNNILYGNLAGDYLNAGNASTIYDHNLTIDPNFISPDTFDFRLDKHSPALDSGLTLSQVSSDIRNVSRPKGRTYDIGAYERDDLDSTILNPPNGLSVK